MVTTHIFFGALVGVWVGWMATSRAFAGPEREVAGDVSASFPPASDGWDDPWAVAGQVGGALSLPSVDFSIEGARRFGNVGVLVKAGWNRWANTQKPPMLTRGTLNLGVGGEYWYFHRRVRAAVVAGPSILLFRTVLDKPGKVGVFVDCYPSSLSWRLAGTLYARVDPLSFHVIAPVLDSIPLVVLEYRTSVALEWRL
jgi:hypothetical protein